MRAVIIVVCALLVSLGGSAGGGDDGGVFGVASARAEPTTEALWRARCAPCHGVSGRGFNQRAQRMAMGDMTTEAWQIEMTDAHIRDTIRNGLQRVKFGNRQAMRHFKGKLTAAQIDALVGFIRGLARGAAPRWPWTFW